MKNFALLLLGSALLQEPPAEAEKPAAPEVEKPAEKAEPPAAPAEKAEPAAEGAAPSADGEAPPEKPKRKPKKKPAPAPEPPAESAAPAPAPEKAPPAAAAKASAADSKPVKADPDRTAAAKVAIRFFEALIGERIDELGALTKSPFSFEGKATANAEETRQRWEEIFAHREGARYALYGVELLTPAEATQKYGKPPKRVSVPAGGYVAIGNLSGRPTVALLAKSGGNWQVVGLHD